MDSSRFSLTGMPTTRCKKQLGSNPIKINLCSVQLFVLSQNPFSGEKEINDAQLHCLFIYSVTKHVLLLRVVQHLYRTRAIRKETRDGWMDVLDRLRLCQHGQQQ